MAITRGYSFDSTELVTAFKLHRLVDGAVVSGLVLSDAFGVEAGSNATQTTGVVRDTYEDLGIEVSTFSGVVRRHHYEIYDSDLGGYCPLFTSDGTMESRRFIGSTDLSSYNPGFVANPDNNGSGYTLAIGDQGIGAGVIHKALIGAVGPASIPALGGGRITIRGFARCFTLRSGQNAGWPFSCYFGDNLGSVASWQASNTTSFSGMYGHKMNNLSGGGDAIQPFYLWGGPTTRP